MKKEICDKAISEAEILKHVNIYDQEKLSGGFLVNFYIFFWCEIKKTF